MDYINEMRKGREIVIVAKDENYDSAIFHMDDEGKIWTYSRELGSFSRECDDSIQEHFENMENDCYIFVRGNAE